MTNATANAVRSCFPVLSTETLPNGVDVLTIPCADSDVLATLPAAVEHAGTLYGRTGWNSDRCVAYFRSDASIARAL